MKRTTLFLALAAASAPTHAEPVEPTWGLFIPQGITVVDFNIGQGRVSSQFNEQGKPERFSTTLSGVPLDGFGLVGDSSQVELSFETNFIEITAGHGITDDLAVGVRLPLVDSCSDAKVGTRNGSGDVLSAALTAQAGPFAYEDVGSHCDSGLVAPIVGAFWRIHSSGRDSLFFMPGIRLGRMTDKNDPDILFQPIADDGANDLILRFDYFRDLGYRFDLAVQLEHGINLSDRQTLRVPQSMLSITPAAFKERLKRDVGDYTILDIEFGYRFLDDQMRVFAAYYQKNKGKDSYKSPSGQSTFYLSDNSDFRDQEYRIGLNWNGIPAWQRGALPLPIQLELNFWESFRGKNALKYYYNEFKVSLAF
ncbi:MAG: hypothetical protein CME36_08000 [unclassified Hahellaceae]|nr:hypothetical protein [Hahellaceae bacterium]|tara:strand:+ start:724 stop:1818 length:1095 start_codon:yes stop_codon:yes gene_type:complete